ncbi:MAG: glycerol-3-phosphate acyltransferase [Coprothermobacterota bacterium]|nr:glycerol-3-phosphate acyltransferase [Coprothermobacterota bacterium]
MGDGLTTSVVFWTVLGFVLGSIPFAPLIGRIALNVDIRQVGDGNPGAGNVWRAGGWRVGMLAVAFDFMKGAVPVYVAHFQAGIEGWPLLPVALAPVLGHALSPFLRFRGGKAVAVSFGIWSGVLGWQGFFGLGISIGLFHLFVESDAWTIILGTATFLLALILFGAPPEILLLAVLNLVLFTWKHWRELAFPIHLNPALFHRG